MSEGSNVLNGLAHPLFFAAWSLWLLYGLYYLFKKNNENKHLEDKPSRWFGLQSFVLLLLPTIAILSLFFVLVKDFKSNSVYFVEKYQYQLNTKNPEDGTPIKNEVTIGSSKEFSHISLENPTAAGSHLKLTMNDQGYEVTNISEEKRVDIDGKYLNTAILKIGDEIVFNNSDRLRILDIGKQFPLGRSITIGVVKKGKVSGDPIILSLFLNKNLTIRFEKRIDVSINSDRVIIPSDTPGPGGILGYEPNLRILGMGIYYVLAFVLILLLSIGIFLYLRNRFNGAVLLLMILSLLFAANIISWEKQLLMLFIFALPIIYVHFVRKPEWGRSGFLVLILYIAVFLLPMLVNFDGDFTIGHTAFSRKDGANIRVKSVLHPTEEIDLFDKSEHLRYGKFYRIILGHTRYDLKVEDKDQNQNRHVIIIPRDPEKIRMTGKFDSIISDIAEVQPRKNYILLKYPHTFTPIPSGVFGNQEKITIRGSGENQGNQLQLSKSQQETYLIYWEGLFYYILIPFWAFWLLNTIIDFFRTLKKHLTPRLHFNQQGVFDENNIVLYTVIYFFLSLGYLIFGALALYNNSYFKNFSSFRSLGLPVFIILFLGSLMIGRDNRWIVFIYRMLKSWNYLTPFSVILILFALTRISPLFWIAEAAYIIMVVRNGLWKRIIYEYKNASHYPIDFKRILERPICSFEVKENQRLFFGLGRLLNKKGWNHLLAADLLLLLALFFIVLQLFLGSELGVTVGGFVFLPIELGKILLTIYFADWVSRIDRGMDFKAFWVYGLVLIPFILLIVFMKDFSPLLIFGFVFLYHGMRIKKGKTFKLFLVLPAALIIWMAVRDLSQYLFPTRSLALLGTLPILYLLWLIWSRKEFRLPFELHENKKKLSDFKKRLIISSVLVALLCGMNYYIFFHSHTVPKVLGDRVSYWMNPWEDYDVSYQYITSVWLMKGSGAFGTVSDTLASATYVPLIEKDMTFSLAVGILGFVGAGLLLLTLFLIAASVKRGRGHRWYTYVLEFLAVIFLAQFLVPAMTVVGILPLMGQPLPFLSYSNNLLLLFVLPFSVLMILISREVRGAETHRMRRIKLGSRRLIGLCKGLFKEFDFKPVYRKCLNQVSRIFKKEGRQKIYLSLYARFFRGFNVFCLIAGLIVLLILLRLNSVSFPTDVEEGTEVVYLESFGDTGNIFKIGRHGHNFEITPYVSGIRVKGKPVHTSIDIRDGDLIAIGDRGFEFKVSPGEYIYKEVFCQSLTYLFPTPRTIKTIGGWGIEDREQILKEDKNPRILKKTLVEIAPQEMKKRFPSLGVNYGKVLELSWDSKTLYLKPCLGAIVRVRGLSETEVKKNDPIEVTDGDIFKIYPEPGVNCEPLYIKLDFRIFEGAEALSVSYREKGNYPYTTDEKPITAYFKSIDNGISYEINPARQTLFVGKRGLFSFRMSLSDFFHKLVIPEKVPQGKLIDYKELLDRKMYYRKDGMFFSITPDFLNKISQDIERIDIPQNGDSFSKAFDQLLLKKNIVWRSFATKEDYNTFSDEAKQLIEKMSNKGIYRSYVEELRNLNAKDHMWMDIQCRTQKEEDENDDPNEDQEQNQEETGQFRISTDETWKSSVDTNDWGGVKIYPPHSFADTGNRNLTSIWMDEEVWERPRVSDYIYFKKEFQLDPVPHDIDFDTFATGKKNKNGNKANNPYILRVNNREVNTKEEFKRALQEGKNILIVAVTEDRGNNGAWRRDKRHASMFAVKNNELSLKGRLSPRPSFRTLNTPGKPAIYDSDGVVLAYSSEINGEYRRFYSKDAPPDIMGMLGANGDETWGLEQIFSKFSNQNPLKEIYLTLKTDWQKIALEEMREQLLENREYEVESYRFRDLDERLKDLEEQLAQARKKLEKPSGNPTAEIMKKIVALQEKIKDIKQEIDVDKNRFYEAGLVLMDTKGRILTAASYPYNEATLKELNPELTPPYLRDTNPNLNRVWKWKYNPGSTAKILDSIAFLNSRKQSQYVDKLMGSSSFRIPRSNLLNSTMLNGKSVPFQLANFQGHTIPEGNCSLVQALTWSYNTYFSYIALHANRTLAEDSTFCEGTRNYIIKSGIPIGFIYKEFPVLEYAERLMMNRQIDLLENLKETPIYPELQRMPNDAMLTIESVFPVNAYTQANVAHYAIGQGDFQLTVLQNALVSSSVLNDGILYYPSLIQEIRFQDNKRNNAPRGKQREQEIAKTAIVPPVEKIKVRVFPPGMTTDIKEGMKQVVVRGTAGGVFGDLARGRTFYAKTGTAETGVYKDNAIFTGFVTLKNNQQIIFSVIVPRSGLGAEIAGKLTAKVLRKIIEYENSKGNSL